MKYHEESDWFSAKSGQGEVTYPAPFDQPFYMILNLAVGGSWVGYPDESTTYDDQKFAIDYVKVYQKDSYDENVTKPIKEVTLRDPDATGNYINNGDFSVVEDLSDTKNWQFMTALGGKGTAEIKNKELVISTTNAGTADYSIQLVQPDIPLQKGGTYKVTFDAYADEARTMIADISGPDHNYTRYWNDTKVSLGTNKQTFTYEFQMTGSDDANAVSNLIWETQVLQQRYTYPMSASKRPDMRKSKRIQPKKHWQTETMSTMVLSRRAKTVLVTGRLQSRNM